MRGASNLISLLERDLLVAVACRALVRFVISLGYDSGYGLREAIFEGVHDIAFVPSAILGAEGVGFLRSTRLLPEGLDIRVVENARGFDPLDLDRVAVDVEF